MNPGASPSYTVVESHSSTHPKRQRTDSELRSAIASACTVLEQTPPPSLREILGAYKSRGDGDRDMLLAMLSAKSAEDQRLASVAALHRTVLEVYQTTPPSSQPPPAHNNSHYYPTPTFTQSPQLHDEKPSRRIHHRASSSSRSPPYAPLPSMRDAPLHNSQPPRKRHRSSRSPSTSHVGTYETHSSSQHEQLPPSPYSSSGSDSAEYSPRSRASMAIGSLLSSGPSRDANGDDSQVNGHTSSERGRAHQNHLPSALAV